MCAVGAIQVPRRGRETKTPLINRGAKVNVSLLPLNGSGFAAWSFQLHPVFGGISKRVPPNDAASHFICLGDKSWDNFKNFFQTQGLSFYFCSKGHGRQPFEAR